jgi:hypothetical protein
LYATISHHDELGASEEKQEGISTYECAFHLSNFKTLNYHATSRYI